MQADGFSWFGRTNEIVEKADYNQSKLDFSVVIHMWTVVAALILRLLSKSWNPRETPLSQKGL